MTQPGKWNATQPVEWSALLADTLHLSTEELGAYLLLIGAYWQRAEPLPDDPIRLARLCRVPLERWASLRPVLAPFFRIEGGAWHHKRIEADLASTRDLYDRRVAQTAAARAVNPKNARSVTDTVTGVELPRGFPATKDDAAVHAAFIGCSEDFAAKTWDKAMSRSGHDARGQPIASWRHHLAFEWACHRERAYKDTLQPAKGTNGATIVVHQQEYERVLARMTSVRRQYADHQTWTPEDKAEIQKLKARKEQLMKILGIEI